MLRRNWVTEDIQTGRLIIKSVRALIDTGMPEIQACRQVSGNYGQDEDRTLIQVWERVKRRLQRQGKFKLQPHVRKPARCLYCGVTGEKVPMVPVADFRGEIVGAHERCEILEQMMAGGL